METALAALVKSKTTKGSVEAAQRKKGNWMPQSRQLKSQLKRFRLISRPIW